MRIAIDMDEVLADAHAGQRALYEGQGVTFSEDDLHGRELRDVAPAEARAEVERRLHTGFFFADLAPMAGAQASLKRLMTDHEGFVATAAMEYPASCIHKIAWMERHFPFFPLSNLVLCGDKSILKADVLIDDHARHFDGFGGTGLLFHAHHNADLDWPHRLEHWDHAETHLERIRA